MIRPLLCANNKLKILLSVHSVQKQGLHKELEAVLVKFWNMKKSKAACCKKQPQNLCIAGKSNKSKQSLTKSNRVYKAL